MLPFHLRRQPCTPDLSFELRATYVGFDSAWTDSAKAPGAICAVRIAPGEPPTFHKPRPAGFADALAFVRDVSAGSAYTLIALDQPTIVRNETGMRVAERVVAAVVSWMGGGVQPANRGKTGIFCNSAPIWRFLTELDSADDPMAARAAASGRYVMEVFPALALASLEPSFYQRHGAPKYNPANRRLFKHEDWRAVCVAAERTFASWGLAEPAAWCRTSADRPKPRKADQDQLDAMLCLAVAFWWRLAPPNDSIMIGDLETGYIITPASAEVRQRLEAAARKRGVPDNRAIDHSTELT